MTNDKMDNSTKKEGINFKVYQPRESAKGVIILTHGFAEHLGRYEELSNFLRDQGWTVISHDLRGHGDSDGFRGYIDDFDHYMIDYDMIRKEAEQMSGGKPIVCFGHSLGGLVTLRYLLSDKNAKSESIKACVLSAPFTRTHQRLSVYNKALVSVANKLNPRMTTPFEDNFLENLTHDETLRASRKADKKCFEHVTIRWLAECQKAQAFVRKNIGSLPVPSYWFLAGQDRVAHTDTAKQFAMKAPNSEIIQYEDFFHEVFHEKERGLPYEKFREILTKVKTAEG